MKPEELKEAAQSSNRREAAPIEDEYKEKMNVLAGVLDNFFNDGKKGKERPTGFVLLVFPFANFDAGDSRCNYISNGADRKDIAKMFRELLPRFEE